VKPSDINWVRGGMDVPDGLRRSRSRCPRMCRCEQAPGGQKTLDGMLRAGEIDGFIAPPRDPAFDEGHPQRGAPVLRRHHHRRRSLPAATKLFPDHACARGPQKHLRHPSMAARRAAEAASPSPNAGASWHSLTPPHQGQPCPLSEDTLAAARQLIGPEIWTYGLPAQRAWLETFLALHHRQGLEPAPKLDLAELFHPATLRPTRYEPRLERFGTPGDLLRLSTPTARGYVQITHTPRPYPPVAACAGW